MGGWFTRERVPRKRLDYCQFTGWAQSGFDETEANRINPPLSLKAMQGSEHDPSAESWKGCHWQGSASGANGHQFGPDLTCNHEKCEITWERRGDAFCEGRRGYVIRTPKESEARRRFLVSKLAVTKAARPAPYTAPEREPTTISPAEAARRKSIDRMTNAWKKR